MKVTKYDAPLPKCYFSHCAMPKYTDQHRLPTKQQPFKAINAYSPAHTIDLLLPEELYAVVGEKILERKFSFARVYMPLLDIISGDFFNQYIKAGNIVMLSEGIYGNQNTFVLRDGVLRLYVDKSTYERCGLVGTAIPGPGRKHIKSRFVVELDLRLSSMRDGKKGFERIKWAFKNVLQDSLAWLFSDLEHEDINSGPIAKLHPQIKLLEPSVTQLTDIIPPFLHSNEAICDQLYEEQLLEWIGLAAVESARISKTDTIDSYLCRYTLPEEYLSEKGTDTSAQTLTHLRWHGFTSPTFLQHLWLLLRTAIARDPNYWFSLSSATFQNESFTLLCPDGQGLLLWECD